MGIFSDTKLLKNFLIYFTGQIPAAKEIWIFGDDFLAQSQGWLKKLEFAHFQDNNMPSLYIHENYNVKTYPTTNTTRNEFLKEIRNAIANTIMRKITLPSAILIMLSNNLLEDAVFAIECMDGIWRWLMDEIYEMIKFQWNNLPPKSKKFDEPRVYVLKAIPKPNKIKAAALFRGVRRKYNSNLQNMLQDYHGFGFINVHEITTREKDEKFFISNLDGTLSDEGTIQLWTSISQTFKAMDEGNKAKALVAEKATQTDPTMGRKNSPDVYYSPRRNSYSSRPTATPGPRRFYYNNNNDRRNQYEHYHDNRRRY